MEKKQQRFIFFKSKYIGQLLKIRINLTSLMKFAKQNKDGDYVVDIFIARKKKPTKDSLHIAWVELEEEPKDNTDLVENTL